MTHKNLFNAFIAISLLLTLILTACGAETTEVVRVVTEKETIVERQTVVEMDVDTASYTLMRRYLRDGHLPDKDSVRVKEYINYFEQDYAPPQRGVFAIHLEGAPSPFGEENYYLLRVGIQGYRVPDDQRKDAALVFVVDVSGSMDMENRLGLVKQALHLLVRELRPTDTVFS